MDYKILCIDDEPSWVDSIKADIESLLKSLGYEPEIIVRENGDDIDSFLGRHDINLIMIDYNLPGHKGDELVRYILQKGNFVELIFYSEDQAAVFKALGSHAGLVHIKGRQEVQQLVLELCAYTDYRYKNVDTMRGLIVAESIALEEMLEEIMVRTFREQGEHFQYDVLNRGEYDFKSKLKFVSRYLKDQASKTQDMYMHSGQKDTKLKEKKSSLDVSIGKLKPFSDEVIEPRNIVAHGKKIIKKDGTVELQALDKGEKNITFTRDWIAGCRERFAHYRIVLSEILSLEIF